MARRSSLWVVTRFAPQDPGWSEEPCFYVSEADEPAGMPLRGFSDKKSAETARKQLERQARETTPINLFFAGLLPERLNDVVAAAKVAKLPPPDLNAIGSKAEPIRERNSVTYTSDFREYSNRVELAVSVWWASISESITPEANAVLWDELFPNFEFYRLSRVLLEG
jgi:hypothetical protein